jgi:hypothetical protein
MKAILKFDLSDPDDVAAHKRCVMSGHLAGALFEITHNLRKKCRYIYDSLPAENADGIGIVFEQIAQVLEEHRINIDEL